MKRKSDQRAPLSHPPPNGSSAAANVAPTLPAWKTTAGLLGLVMSIYGLSGLPSLTAPLPQPLPFNAQHPFLWLAVSFVFLMYVFSRRETPSGTAWGPWRTRLLLGLAMGAGMYLRIHPITEPNPLWSEDFGLCLIDGRNALDFPDARPLIFPYGSRTPFIPYLVVLAYGLFPAAPSLFILKLVWALVDVAAIWVHYLLGKELGGRRTGLILAAAFALSKPALVNCVSGQVPVSTPLALGLMLLFTFRFLKKTDVKHAVQWGMAIAFGAYCYTTVRPFLGWIPIAVSAWILLRARMDDRPRAFLPFFGICAVWTIAFLRVNLNMPGSENFQKNCVAVAWLVTALLLIAGAVNLIRLRNDSGVRPLGILILGLAVAAVLMEPLLLNPYWATHSQGASVLNPQHPYHPSGGLSPSFWWSQISTGLKDMILTFRDRDDMGLPGEAFWSIHSMPLVFLGLAWAFRRRNATAWFLLGCTAVGFLPHILSYDSHTGRLMGVVTPLLLLGAVAWNQLLSILETRGTGYRAAGACLMAVWSVWTFHGMRHRFQVELFRHNNNIPVTYQAVKRHLGTHRVFLVPGNEISAPGIFNPLVYDQGDLFLFDPRGNEVPRFNNGRVPNVVVCFQTSDVLLRNRLLSEFPKGRLVKNKPGGWIPPETPPHLDLFYIDGIDIPAKPSGLFRTVPAPENAWSRRYHLDRFGLGHGILTGEDWVADPSSPFPLFVRTGQTIVIRGSFRVPTEGWYSFAAEVGNYAVLELDGQGVLDYRPTDADPGNPNDGIYLKNGVYSVELRTYLRASLAPPKIWVGFPGHTTTFLLGTYPTFP